MVVDTTHCLVAGAILLGKEELNIVSWTGSKLSPALRGKTLANNKSVMLLVKNIEIKIDSVLLAGLAKRPLVPHS